MLSHADTNPHRVQAVAEKHDQAATSKRWTALPSTVELSIGSTHSAIAASAETAELFDRSKVDRALEALVADWERQEGHLERTRVERLALKRNLAPEEILGLFAGLAERGILFEDENRDEKVIGVDVCDAEPGPVELDGGTTDGDFTVDYFSRQLLSRREEVELGRAVQIGLLARIEAGQDGSRSDLEELVAHGERARARLIEGNLRLVLWQARRHARALGSLQINDLVQEGTIGLMRAAEMFDPDLGLRFSTYSTYATWWIRQAMFRAIDNNANIIRLPIHRLEQVRKLRRTARLLELETGREPSLKDLVVALGWEAEKVAYIQRLSTLRTVPIDAPLNEYGEMTPAQIIESPAPNPEELTQPLS